VIRTRHFTAGKPPKNQTNRHAPRGTAETVNAPNRQRSSELINANQTHETLFNKCVNAK
jgi:hypothetical protein